MSRTSAPFFCTRTGVSLVNYAPPGRPKTQEELENDRRAQFKNSYAPGTSSTAAQRAARRKRSTSPQRGGGHHHHHTHDTQLIETCRELEEEIAEQRSELEHLRGIVSACMDKDAEIERLRAENRQLSLELEKRDHAVANTKKEISKMENKVNEVTNEYQQKLDKQTQQIEEAQEKHKLTLLSAIQGWSGKASMESVRVMWGGWRRLQQEGRMEKALAKERRKLLDPARRATERVLSKLAQGSTEAHRKVCFLQWLDLYRVEKRLREEIARKAYDKEVEEEQLRQKVARENERTRLLQLRRATALRWVGELDGVQIKSCFDVWKEFVATMAKEKELEKLSQKHAEEKREARIAICLALVGGKEGGDNSTFLQVVLSAWRESTRVARNEREVFEEKERLKVIHDQQIQQERRRSAMLLQQDGSQMQKVILFRCWREYVQISQKEKFMEREKGHEENIKREQSQRMALLIGMTSDSSAGKLMQLRLVWSAWQEFLKELKLEREREQFRQEAAVEARQAMDKQRQLQAEHLVRLAFVQEDMIATVMVRTYFDAWREFIRGERTQRSYTTAVRRASVLHEEERENLQKLTEIQASQMSNVKEKLGGMVVAWSGQNEKVELEYLFSVWKNHFLEAKQRKSRGQEIEVKNAGSTKRRCFAGCIILVVAMLAAGAIALLLLVWKGGDTDYSEARMIMAVAAAMVFFVTVSGVTVYLLCQCRCVRKPRRPLACFIVICMLFAAIAALYAIEYDIVWEPTGDYEERRGKRAVVVATVIATFIVSSSCTCHLCGDCLCTSRRKRLKIGAVIVTFVCMSTVATVMALVVEWRGGEGPDWESRLYAAVAAVVFVCVIVTGTVLHLLCDCLSKKAKSTNEESWHKKTQHEKVKCKAGIQAIVVTTSAMLVILGLALMWNQGMGKRNELVAAAAAVLGFAILVDIVIIIRSCICGGSCTCRKKQDQKKVIAPVDTPAATAGSISASASASAIITTRR